MHGQLKNWLTIFLAFLIAIAIVGLASVGVYRGVNAVSMPESIPYQSFHVLLAAASLAMLFLSVVIAIVAVFGWNEIQTVIERQVDSALKESRNAYQGGIKLATGTMYGRLCREERGEEIEITSPFMLESAIEKTKEAYDLLQESGDDWAELKAANNLAFYYALSESDRNATTAIVLAQKLRTHHDFAAKPPLINTYGRVVAVFAEFFDQPDRKLEEAERLLEGLIDSSKVRMREKKNARRHLGRLRRTRQEIERRDGQ